MEQSLACKLLSLIFPNYCLGCKKAEVYLCKNCTSGLSRIAKWENNNLILYSYADPLVRRAITNMKYLNYHGLARELGYNLGELILEELPDLENKAPNWYITSVPLSKRVGFLRQHTKRLAGEVASLTNLRYQDTLRKVRHTPRQASLSKEERYLNLNGSIALKSGANVKDRSYILVDDVLTTGTTIRTCAEALMRGGANRVVGLILAH